MESTDVNQFLTAVEIGYFTPGVLFSVALLQVIAFFWHLFKATAKAYRGEIDSTIR